MLICGYVTELSVEANKTPSPRPESAREHSNVETFYALAVAIVARKGENRDVVVLAEPLGRLGGLICIGASREQRLQSPKAEEFSSIVPGFN